MKYNTILTLVLGLGIFTLSAQNDTLLFEDFEGGSQIPYIQVQAPDTVLSFVNWINYDADGLQTEGGSAGEWFYSKGFSQTDSSAKVYASKSWLTSDLDSNLNYLILPAIYISDATASISWKSCPRQLPLYLDGYSLLVSTSDNLASSFTDTLFTAAEYDPNGALGGPGNPLIPEFDMYKYSPGWIHGWDGTGVEYDSISSTWIGTLLPHSASLSDYEGQTIYIAFVHTSFSDNLVAIDDVLVMGNGNMSISEGILDDILLSPNPVQNELNIEFSSEMSSIELSVYNSMGQCVKSSQNFTLSRQKATVNTSDLPTGLYSVSIRSESGVEVKTFIKR